MAYKRILVPVDGSPTSGLGLREAIDFAKAQKARLHLVHVVDVHNRLMAGAQSGARRERHWELTLAGRRQFHQARNLWDRAQARLRAALGQPDWTICRPPSNASPKRPSVPDCLRRFFVAQ